MEAPTSTARRPWITRPAWFVAGLGVAYAVALVLEPRWVDLCSRVDTRGRRCAPIDLPTMFGYALVGLGFFTMILGPVVNSLYHLARHGQRWETTRHETAVSNVPLLAGFIYFAGGFAVAALV